MTLSRSIRLTCAALACAAAGTLTACGAPGHAKDEVLVNQIPPLGTLPDLPAHIRDQAKL